MSTAKPPPGCGWSSACCPIQASIPCSLTRCANTTSGGASMTIEVENSAIPAPTSHAAAGFGLGGALQRGQVSWPEAIEELLHHPEAVRPHLEEVPGALTLLANQARPAEHSEVVRDGLLGHRDPLGDLPHGPGLVAHQDEDPPAVTVGQRPQRGVEVSCRSGRGARHLTPIRLNIT